MSPGLSGSLLARNRRDKNVQDYSPKNKKGKAVKHPEDQLDAAIRERVEEGGPL